MIKYKKGNVVTALQNGEIEVLVHGCNCFKTMGAGVALETKKAFPQAYEDDLSTVYGDYNKLGTIGISRISFDPVKIVINAYTQYNYGNTERMVDYDALRLCMRKIKHNNTLSTRKIGMPKIGCGLAGGDWNVVSKIVEEELGDCDVTVYEL